MQRRRNESMKKVKPSGKCIGTFDGSIYPRCPREEHFSQTLYSTKRTEYFHFEKKKRITRRSLAVHVRETSRTAHRNKYIIHIRV
jgi:hypothetical protein